MNDPSQYPEVRQILAVLKKLQPQIETISGQPELAKLFYRKIQITIKNKRFSIPVMDEYNDVE